ncbi:hypothetical protein SDC9_134005 [bioreactor metagenome]|uniref:Uncharacterized protein n=1 Tax=bioreactor metagenome TaxID=1076179 RepID=A0A645DEA7_9ZZZZ
MHRSLLVAYQDMPDLILLEKGIVDVQNGTAWVSEHAIDLFFLQAPDYNFRTADHHTRAQKAVNLKGHNLNRHPPVRSRFNP